MANCYNCIHIEVCDISIKLETHDKPKMLDHKCVYFKDKEKFYHLPCKVSDKVYQVADGVIFESTINKIIYDAGHIAFDESAIGKSVFLTKEEAEMVGADND